MLQMENDLQHMHRAIDLARQTRQAGNLPVGSVITLDDEIIAEGQNSIWSPKFNPSRHAEMEAMAVVPTELWPRANEMVLYTTLEPCLMCMSAILMHRIGRIVFGSHDVRGGASLSFGHLPPAFERLRQNVEWVGPFLPEVCNELDQTVATMMADYKNRVWGVDQES
jgi:tRNA(adenine34) deaminase